jgi:hypothetical protein
MKYKDKKPKNIGKPSKTYKTGSSTHTHMVHLTQFHLIKLKRDTRQTHNPH